MGRFAVDEAGHSHSGLGKNCCVGSSQYYRDQEPEFVELSWLHSPALQSGGGLQYTGDQILHRLSDAASISLTEIYRPRPSFTDASYL